MKRSGFKQKIHKPLKRTPLRKKSKSDTALLKEEIQRLVREIVMKRDGGCILRNKRHCGGILGTTGVVFQADHLITRANSATFADTRLIVCLCRSCHGGWKQWHKEEYDALVKTILPKERVALWDRAQNDSWRASKMDWKLEILALKKELSTYL